GEIGKLEGALQEALEALRLAPREALGYAALAVAYGTLDRFAEVKAVAQRALDQHLDNPGVHQLLLEVAFLEGDLAGVQRESGWGKGRPDEFTILGARARVAAYNGHLQEARRLYGEAASSAEQAKFAGKAAFFLALRARTEALSGDLAAARADAAAALA